MTTTADVRQRIRESRLGSCWKCMAFTACMLVISAVAVVMTMRWQDLEGTESVLAARLAVGAAFISTCAFALLGIAHLVFLVLRKSIWRE